jgi:hypothetical protein
MIKKKPKMPIVKVKFVIESKILFGKTKMKWKKEISSSSVENINGFSWRFSWAKEEKCLNELELKGIIGWEREWG